MITLLKDVVAPPALQYSPRDVSSQLLLTVVSLSWVVNNDPPLGRRYLGVVASSNLGAFGRDKLYKYQRFVSHSIDCSVSSILTCFSLFLFFPIIHHQNSNILVSLNTLYTQLPKMQFFQLSALLAIVSVAAAQGNVTTISGTIISGAFSDLPTFSPSYFPSDALTDLIGGSASD